MNAATQALWIEKRPLDKYLKALTYYLLKF